MKKLVPVIVLLVCAAAVAQNQDPSAEIRRTVEQFEAGLKQRDLARIEAVVAPDMVAFENGHRNDTWADFRDHHLVPEMKEPAPPSQTELVRVSATAEMGWAYTRTTMTLTRRSGEKVEGVLWSVYVLEKRGGEWKIVVLDWSMRFKPTKS